MKKIFIMILIGLSLTSFTTKEINTYKGERSEMFIIEENEKSIDSFNSQSIIKQIC